MCYLQCLVNKIPNFLTRSTSSYFEQFHCSNIFQINITQDVCGLIEFSANVVFNRILLSKILVHIHFTADWNVTTKTKKINIENGIVGLSCLWKSRSHHYLKLGCSFCSIHTHTHMWCMFQCKRLFSIFVSSGSLAHTRHAS